MSTVPALISKNVGNTLTNYVTWNGVMINATSNGVVGGGVVDDTAALQAIINDAIAVGKKAIYFEHGTNGQYKVTTLTNADQVVFFGDNATFVGGYAGTINQFGSEGVVAPLYIVGNNVGIVEPNPVSTLHVGGALTIAPAGHSALNLPSWDAAVHIASAFAKNEEPSGGYGMIKFFSNNLAGPPEEYLQGTIGIVTAVDPAMRRMSIGCIEQNVAFRNLALQEVGGNVIVGATTGSSKLWVNGDMTIAPHGNMPVGHGGGFHMGMAYSKAATPSGGFGTILIVSDDTQPLTGSISLVTSPTAGLRRLSIGCIENGVSLRNLTLNEAGGNVGIGTNNPTSALQVVGLPVYANNAAAVTGGLTAGAFYRTGADPDPVCVVH